jgi:hypothetical protein
MARFNSAPLPIGKGVSRTAGCARSTRSSGSAGTKSAPKADLPHGEFIEICRRDMPVPERRTQWSAVRDAERPRLAFEVKLMNLSMSGAKFILLLEGTPPT